MKDLRLPIFGIILFLAGCKHTPEPKPQNTTCTPVSFSRDINPIIQQNCAISGCHNNGFANGDFTLYSDLKVKVDNGSFHNSVIDFNAPKMPPAGKLPDAQLNLLQCWLNQGAPNN